MATKAKPKTNLHKFLASGGDYKKFKGSIKKKK